MLFSGTCSYRGQMLVGIRRILRDHSPVKDPVQTSASLFPLKSSSQVPLRGTWTRPRARRSTRSEDWWHSLKPNTVFRGGRRIMQPLTGILCLDLSFITAAERRGYPPESKSKRSCFDGTILLSLQ